MKKVIVSTLVAFGFFLSAFITSSAMAGSIGVGLIASGAQVSASGTETEGSGDKEVSGTVNKSTNAFIPAFFAEYSIGEGHGMTFGFTFTPADATIGAEKRTDTDSRAGTGASGDDTGTYNAKAKVSNSMSLYVEPTVMYDTFGLYLKGGLARLKVNAIDDIAIGENSSSYPDKWVNGFLFGVGITNRFDSGLFYKLEATKASYSDVNLRSTTGNKNIINASVDKVAANFAIGYRF